MKLDFEYGQGSVSAELPEDTEVFIPGITVKDPACIPEDQIAEETLKSIRNPIGMEPLSKLAHKGSKCVIVFPDRVKGGEQPTAHRKVSIRLILDELYAAGVEKKDILLICSNGLHRKNTEQEIRGVLGDALYNEFNPTNQIMNHDSEDDEHLIDLGFDEAGDHVIMNKYVFEADVAILIGHTGKNERLAEIAGMLRKGGTKVIVISAVRDGIVSKQALCDRHYSLALHRCPSCT